MTTKVHCPHDNVFKSLMTEKRVAKDFFLQYLPEEIKKSVDLQTLKIQKKSFCSRKLASLHADILYQVEFDKKPGYLYLLCEHQSTVDKLLAFRLLQYSIEIMKEHLKKNKTSVLPVVYPIVFYHGKQSYTGSTDLFDLFAEHKELAKNTLLKPFRLIDLNKISDEECLTHLWSGVLSIIFKHIFKKDLVHMFQKIAGHLHEIESLDGAEFTSTMVNYIFTQQSEEEKIHVVEALKGALTPNMGDKIMTIAESYIEEGRKEGLQAGLQKGHVEGHKEGLQQGRAAGEETGFQKAMTQIAITLLKKGESPQSIAEITGLTLQQIESLTESAQK